MADCPVPGGPYGPGGPPSSHPLEPFGYYHSQLPARLIPNSQILARPIPNSQVGLRVGINTAGYTPKPGETYHPHRADFYSVPAPVIPVRPGVYLSPMPYDGSYDTSPMSFCNPNEKDIPNTGTVPPHVYNRSPNQKACPDTGKFPTRAISFGPGPAMAKEQMDSDQFPDDYQGPYKVLRKQHEGWGENNFDDDLVASMHHSEKGSSQILVASVNLPERKTNAVDESLLRKVEPLASPSKGLQHILAIKKDAALIDKIEGLNIKARISDGRTEAQPTIEEKEKQLGIMNPKAVLSASGSVRSAVLKKKSNASGAFNPLHKGSVDASIVDGGYEPTAVGRVLPLVTQRPRQI